VDDRTLILLGSHEPTLSCDIQKLRGVIAGCDVGAVNRAAVLYPGTIKYLFTNHPEHLLDGQAWEVHRRMSGWNTDYTTISDCQYGDDLPVDLIMPKPLVAGGSMLYAVLVSLELGYGQIIIAGSPMSDEQYAQYHTGWRFYANRLSGRVRATHGWLKGFLEGLEKCRLQ
jgi:hypothetical protein